MYKNTEEPYYLDKDFLLLQQEWYSKLNHSGFQDIEKTFSSGKISRFVKMSCRIDLKRHPYIMDSTYSYYSLAIEFLHHANFDTDLEKSIWEHHAEGLSYRQIQTALKTNLQRVFKTVKKYEKKMFEYNKIKEMSEEIA